MRSAFGVISLLLVLLVVLLVMRHELRGTPAVPGSAGLAGIDAAASINAQAALAEQQVRKALAEAAAVRQSQLDAADPTVRRPGGKSQ